MVREPPPDRLRELLRLHSLPRDAELASLLPAIERLLRARQASPARERKRTLSRLTAIAARYRSEQPQVSAEIDELARLLSGIGI